MAHTSQSADQPQITRTLRLEYPAALVREPILTRLIRQFDLTVSILGAQIALDEGWVELTASGPAAELDRAVAWLTAQGLRVAEQD